METVSLMTALGQLIDTVGFPIGCCVLLFWWIQRSEKQHKEEISKLSDAVNNNTLVVQKLLDRLEMEDDL